LRFEQIRAALAETLETSDFASVEHRIQSLLDDEAAPSLATE